MLTLKRKAAIYSSPLRVGAFLRDELMMPNRIYSIPEGEKRLRVTDFVVVVYLTRGFCLLFEEMTLAILGDVQHVHTCAQTRSRMHTVLRAVSVRVSIYASVCVSWG